MPIWICLERIQFGRFVFHKPLKREYHIGNPFTKKGLGWEVSTNPVIEGRVEHKEHWFGEYALLIIFMLYKRELFKQFFNELLKWKKIRFEGRFIRIPNDLPF